MWLMIAARAIALDLMARATVHQLRDDADGLASLIAAAVAGPAT
jgi:hypothetical protein